MLAEIAWAELQDYVDRRARYEDVVQTDNVGVAQRAEHGGFSQDRDWHTLVCIRIIGSFDCDALVEDIVVCLEDDSSRSSCDPSKARKPAYGSRRLLIFFSFN